MQLSAGIGEISNHQLKYGAPAPSGPLQNFVERWDTKWLEKRIFTIMPKKRDLPYCNNYWSILLCV